MKRTETRNRLLRVGLDQMSVNGISGVTLGQLADGAGLSKSGLFAHFKSKEQLQIDLLDEMATTADRVVVKPAMKEEPGLPRLRLLVDLWFGWSGRAGLRGGCPLAAAMFELDDLDGEVRQHAAAFEAHWRGVLSELVDEAVAAGHLAKGTDTNQFVWELCGIYLGHHASSRFLRDPNADDRARRAFEALVDRHRENGGRKPPARRGQGRSR